MTHRLGSVINLGVQVDIGPDTGPATTPPNTWAHTFPVDPLARFVVLHFNGASLPASDRLEVDLGYDTDVYTAAWGPDFWSRPIRGDQAVAIRYIRTGGGGGHVTLDQYGRGEAMANGGATNTNTDVFLLASPYTEHSPAAQYSGGKFPPGSAPTWENVACLPDGIMKDTARSVGIYIEVDGDHLSSCTATLIAPDLIVTAGHCTSTTERARTGSITFDFLTDCAGNRPVGYNPKFHKLKRVVKAKYITSQIDYSVIQIVTPPGGLGLPPVPFRSDVPPLDDPLFIIHHPRGAIKKVSRQPNDANCKVLPIPPGDPPGRVHFNCDIDNGSSGSSIFDSAGRIVANLSMWVWGTSSLAIAQDLATAEPPPRDVDVVLVFDRSGSMSLVGFGTSDTKLQQAQRAAALFISLLRTDKTHRAGLVTFSTTPTSDFALAPVSNPATKDSLIGPVPPGTAGLIGAIVASGNTTIGGGLQTAASLFPTPTPTSNTRTILLLTDGLHNTPPPVADGEAALGSAIINVIGFGTDANLDGPGLTRLSRDHGGIYWRAEEALSLKKYFALAFGNIFNFGVALDPQFFLADGVMSGPQLDVNICGETVLTAILGWDNPNADLRLSLRSPGGSTITSFSPGVSGAFGDTWAHLRISLPFAGEQDGVWKVEVTRPGGGGEFPPPTPATSYFVTTLVDGGPPFYPIVQPPVYTGDVINPLVALSPPTGGHMHAEVTVEIDSPDEGTGNILTREGLGAPGSINGDAVDARTQKLIDLETAKGSPLIPASKRIVTLFDDGAHDDGAMEEDGVFGNPLADVTRAEGNYTFHAIATYGHDCLARRETTWSVYVSIGVDPGTTTVTSTPGVSLPDGREKVCLTFTPRDRYGNHLGPGRAGSLPVSAQPGSQLDGVLTDNGDGSYTQCVIWDPDSETPPGVSIDQPRRPPVVVTDPRRKTFHYVVNLVCGKQEDCGCECAAVRPGNYATEINIHNPHDKEARIRKYVVPVVFSGAAIGREPRIAGRKPIDKTVLPPHSATMDDCCRIGDLLAGIASSLMPLTIGILEIVSSVELNITAVFTVSELKSGRTSIDVQQIKARPRDI